MQSIPGMRAEWILHLHLHPRHTQSPAECTQPCLTAPLRPSLAGCCCWTRRPKTGTCRCRRHRHSPHHRPHSSRPSPRPHHPLSQRCKQVQQQYPPNTIAGIDHRDLHPQGNTSTSKRILENNTTPLPRGNGLVSPWRVQGRTSSPITSVCTKVVLVASPSHAKNPAQLHGSQHSPLAQTAHALILATMVAEWRMH